MERVYLENTNHPLTTLASVLDQLNKLFDSFVEDASYEGRMFVYLTHEIVTEKNIHSCLGVHKDI
jgi:hypothetical protein